MCDTASPECVGDWGRYKLLVTNARRAKKELGNSRDWAVVQPTQRRWDPDREQWRRVPWQSDQYLLVFAALTPAAIVSIQSCPAVARFEDGEEYTDPGTWASVYLPRPLMRREIEDVLAHEAQSGPPSAKRKKTDFQRLEAGRAAEDGYWRHPLAHKGYGKEYKELTGDMLHEQLTGGRKNESM